MAIIKKDFDGFEVIPDDIGLGFYATFDADTGIDANDVASMVNNAFSAGHLLAIARAHNISATAAQDGNGDFAVYLKNDAPIAPVDCIAGVWL